MPNKPWSQAEENQLVGSLPAGNSIELIATNLSRSTNEVFSRAIGALVALAALPFGTESDVVWCMPNMSIVTGTFRGVALTRTIFKTVSFKWVA